MHMVIRYFIIDIILYVGIINIYKILHILLENTSITVIKNLRTHSWTEIENIISKNESAARKTVSISYILSSSLSLLFLYNYALTSTTIYTISGTKDKPFLCPVLDCGARVSVFARRHWYLRLHRKHKWHKRQTVFVYCLGLRSFLLPFYVEDSTTATSIENIICAEDFLWLPFNISVHSCSSSCHTTQ